MELKLVYRALRKISDWTVGGFYSEVYVEGRENVPRGGPLIIASSHHNEIIDIATLAVTIPHRRHLSFWAKSSLFVNPITHAILTSSGAIPVRRNPNKEASTSDNSTDQRDTPHQSNLFRETSHALAKEQVIGVFPEGTSYTQPGIIQTMPGAAWAAVEYAKCADEKEPDGKGRGKELVIVPVGIVYTDKAHYLSRICVKYGTPIVVSDYTTELLRGDNVDASSKMAVKKIMVEVEKQMLELTINAPNWDTLYAAQTARELLWDDVSKIPLRDWVAVSQSLIKVFAPPSPKPSREDSLDIATASLARYCALLHHTRINPSILNSLLPFNVVPPSSLSTLQLLALKITAQLPSTILGLIFFIPPMLLHLPAYLVGSLSGKYIAAKGEEETKAQCKAIGGGVGLGTSVGLALWYLRGLKWMSVPWGLIDKEVGTVENAKRIMSLLGAVYGSVYVLIRWHSMLVARNYRRFKQLSTFYKLFIGLLRNREAGRDELEAYSRPPPPPPNPFIKKKDETTRIKKSPEAKPEITTARLIKPLLKARAEAYLALHAHLRDLEDKDGEIIRFLRGKGAKIPTSSG